MASTYTKTAKQRERLMHAVDRPSIKTPGASARPHSLDELTKEELYLRAQEADIPGRSEMTKDQLVAALRRQS